MAIVRRAMGRAAVPGQAVPAQTVPEIPQQPQLTAAPGYELAASVTTPPAPAWAVLAAFGLAAAGAGAAWDIGQLMHPTAFHVGSESSAFAALFVFAAAVERLIEPLSRWMPGRGAQERYERALADLDNGVPGAIHAAAFHRAAADQARASRSLIMWGVATFLATVLSAGAGFYLLRMISADAGWHGVSAWVDALVTGLIVGSGTKPLHDLWNRIQPT